MTQDQDLVFNEYIGFAQLDTTRLQYDQNLQEYPFDAAENVHCEVTDRTVTGGRL